MTAAVETRDLVKDFRDVRALAGIDLTIEEGEIFGVIGPNGAGKTTTMRILVDILRPTSGRVRVLGVDPRVGGGKLRKRIGYLPGELSLPARTDVASLLSFYGRLSGGVDDDRIRELAQRFDLDLSRQVRTLSKGNKQKVGVIQAFMHRPELLILDEPTSGLDPLLQQEFIGLVREARREGATVFLSSHVLSEIEHVSDRVAILREGEIITVSTVDGLRELTTHRLRLQLANQASATDFAAMPGVLRAHDENGWVALDVDGSLNDVLRRAVEFGVIDLVAEKPDLEQAVLDMYRNRPTSRHHEEVTP